MEIGEGSNLFNQEPLAIGTFFFLVLLMYPWRQFLLLLSNAQFEEDKRHKYFNGSFLWSGGCSLRFLQDEDVVSTWGGCFEVEDVLQDFLQDIVYKEVVSMAEPDLTRTIIESELIILIFFFYFKFVGL